MPPLVTVQELRDHMNSPRLAGAQEQAARRILDGLEHDLRNYLRTSLLPEERTETLYVDGSGFATVRNSPITSVSAISVDGVALTGPFTDLSGNSVYVGSAYGGRSAVVTYVGGPDHSERADMKLAILNIAARAMAPRHDEGRTVTGLSTDRNDEAANPERKPPEWTEDELKKFRNDRRPLGL